MTKRGSANDNAPRTLAEQLAYVLAHRNMPDHEPEPLQSNWITEPATLIEPEVRATVFAEQYLRVTPSLDEIARQMDYPEERAAPEDGGKRGKIIAIGRLRFSDGTQTEKAFTIGPDGDVIQYDRRMPTGAMLGTEERLTDGAGGNTPAKVTISNSALAERMDVRHVEYIPGKTKRRGKSYTAEESRALIAEATANTPVMPPVTKLPPGLANGTARASDCFIGMKIGSTGKGGAPAWQDVFTSLEDRETWHRAHDELSPKDKAVLGKAMTARTIADLGENGHRRTLERQGWKHLIAANDNFAAAIKKHAS